MIAIPSGASIYLCTTVTDMRKSCGVSCISSDNSFNRFLPTDHGPQKPVSFFEKRDELTW